MVFDAATWLLVLRVLLLALESPADSRTKARSALADLNHGDVGTEFEDVGFCSQVVTRTPIPTFQATKPQR